MDDKAKIQETINFACLKANNARTQKDVLSAESYALALFHAGIITEKSYRDLLARAKESCQGWRKYFENQNYNKEFLKKQKSCISLREG